jgi:arylformamidase
MSSSADPAPLGLLAGVLDSSRLVDLTHRLTAGIPSFPTHPKVFRNPWPSRDDPAELNQIVMSDHSGTHVDAPAHFVPGDDDPRRVFVDAVPIDAFVGPAVHLAFGPFAPDGVSVSAADIEAWETEHGPIQRGDIVLFDFGWGREHWAPVPEGFAHGVGWPGLAPDAAQLMVDRGVKAVGTDCLSIDPAGASGDGLRAHYTLLPNHVLILENLANMEQLPDRCFLIALPLPIAGGTGSPVRAVAVLPE